MSSSPDRPPLVGAAEIGSEFGVSTGTARRLYRERLKGEEPLFPEPVDRRGREQLWERPAVASWFAAHRGPDAKGRLQEAAASAGAGDPDELLNASQVAKLLGYKNPNQITTYLRDHPGYFPDPDHTDVLGTPERPWRRHSWRRGTVTAWAASRPGKGRRSGSNREAQPLPDVSREGDPDELLSVPEAAALLGFKSGSSFSSSLAQGNLPLLEGTAVPVSGSNGRPQRRWTRRQILLQDADRNRTN